MKHAIFLVLALALSGCAAIRSALPEVTASVAVAGAKVEWSSKRLTDPAIDLAKSASDATGLSTPVEPDKAALAAEASAAEKRQDAAGATRRAAERALTAILVGGDLADALTKLDEAKRGEGR